MENISKYKIASDLGYDLGGPMVDHITRAICSKLQDWQCGYDGFCKLEVDTDHRCDGVFMVSGEISPEELAKVALQAVYSNIGTILAGVNVIALTKHGD